MVSFRRIGAGFCGGVWALPEGSYALKREDGGPERSLHKDFKMHNQVLTSLEQMAKQNFHPIRIILPQCNLFIQPEDYDWWDENLSRFPEGYSPCKTIDMERIRPFPKDVREYLIEKFCPDPLVAEIKASDANQDCLIRRYLGRRRLRGRKQGPSRFAAFSLRNFPLHEDQMEELGIDPTVYAEIMAETLAIMHWRAEVDANDVEFVLAPPRSGSESQASNVLGEHSVWLLGFDCCNQMPMVEDGVKQAAGAFFRNDTYYPRPGQRMWKVFRDRYQQTSSDVLLSQADDGKTEASAKRLPGLFLELVEEEQQKRDRDIGPSSQMES